MENTPVIVLFWYFGIVIFIFMITLMIVAIKLIKKGKRQSDKKILSLGKICMSLSIICSIPLFLVAGYILYIYIGVMIN